MVPPVSWASFLADIRLYVTDVLGVADDDALDTVLRVQLALIPARGRQFPVEIPLANDYVTWHGAVTALRDDGHYRDWHELIVPLRDLGPGSLSVDDPLNSCGEMLGYVCGSLHYYDNAWDMVSPVSRPRQGAPSANPRPDMALSAPS